MRAYPLSPQQQELLGVLTQAPDGEEWWTRAQLEDATGLSTCRVTQSLASLARRGLVTRESHSDVLGGQRRRHFRWCATTRKPKEIL
jgi:DNA-binding MarR family transcriptional regulator